MPLYKEEIVPNPFGGSKPSLEDSPLLLFMGGLLRPTPYACRIPALEGRYVDPKWENAPPEHRRLEMSRDGGGVFVFAMPITPFGYRSGERECHQLTCLPVLGAIQSSNLVEKHCGRVRKS